MRRATPFAVVMVLCSLPSQASAQEEPSAADVSAARAMGQDGVKLAEAGNCQEAIDKLARAEKIFHAPTTLGRLGECQVQIGKIVDGTENLNRVAREAISPTAPTAFREAQDRARRVLAEAKPKIAKLKIAVAAPPDAKLTVTVDGEAVPLANLNTNRPMDPGEHLIEATAPGYLKATSKVKLAEGGIDSTALTLEVDPNASKAPIVAPTTADRAAQTAQTANAPRSAERPQPSKVPAYVALGAGAVGVGVGAVFGGLALGKKSDLDSACKNKVCASPQQSTIDSGKTLGTVSTVGFVVGVVGLGLGTVLLFTGGSAAPSASGRTRSNPLQVRVGSAGVEPVVGVDRLGVSGTF